MSIVTRNSTVPQICCRAMTVDNSTVSFRYEVNVLVQWVTNNYQFACWVVDNGKWLAREREDG
ncbi:hypothetical protein KGP26_18315 [Serratia sp. JSRIV002]|nr:hypothetical protein KGP26_18315 [Serratia sp. JSRIV002]